MKDNFLGLRLTPREAAILNRLTQETGRDRSNLTRALIHLAGSDPAYRQRLGSLTIQDPRSGKGPMELDPA